MIENINIDVVPQQVDVEVLENTDIELTVNKREFNIVGDNVYIAQVSETPPQWLTDIVNSAVQLSINNTMTELRDLKDSILDELNVVKNQYTMAINQIATSEANFVSAVETLNATYQDTQATIANIQTTYATKAQASATALGIVQSELQDGAIAAEILTLKNTFVTPLNATSSSLEILESTIGDPDDGIGATAEAVRGLETRVESAEGTISSTAADMTKLKTAANMGELTAGGFTGLVNSVDTVIDAEGARVESKFEYGSTLTINGTPFTSGFGLVSNATNVNGKPTSGSEFWINADKFKFTNASNTGAKAPFAIDATGTTPEIYFNGKVSFNSISDASTTIPTIASVTTAQNTANSKVKTFYQTSIPTAISVGDIWVDTDDGNKMYRAASIGANEIKAGEWENASQTIPTVPTPEATITSTSTPGTTVKNPGTIWRYQPNASIAKYTHYISLGSGVWQEIGGTYIDGSSIVTGTIDAARLNVNDIFSKNITFTGTITGGSTDGTGIIKSNNYVDGVSGMKIDLRNGSIYIA